jgi:protein phosphatase 1 regulatory subunit 11
MSTSGGMKSIVSTENEEIKESNESKEKIVILRLKEKPSVKWTEETLDNENMGKKSSKRCCIYHKNKKFAESDSDESDSDTEIAKSEVKEGKTPNYLRHHG